MAKSVDPSKVIEKLALHIAKQVVENIMNEVALEDANTAIAAHERRAGPDAD